MSQPVRRRATYEDVLALPEHVVGEIVSGVLHVSSRPAARHALAATRLLGELEPAFRQRGAPAASWVMLVEPELHLAEHVLVPDLAGWRRDRVADSFAERAFIELTPDWVCEVLSPRTAAFDRGAKREAYAECGVGYLWFVDPAQRIIEVLRLDGATYRVVDVATGEAGARAEPFQEFTLSLSVLWTL